MLALLSLLSSSPAAAAAPLYEVADVSRYLRNDTSALIANHLLLQSMFSIDAAPSTIGFSLKTSPARFSVASGEISDGSLSKWGVVALVGGGKPATGAAWFTGVNYAHLITGGFPNVLAGAGNGDPQKVVSAGGGSAVFFVGGAYKGVALEGGVFFNGAGYESDPLGRFGAGCPYTYGCGPWREGAPMPAVEQETYDVTDRSYLLNLEHKGGHALAALFSEQPEAASEEQVGGLTMLRGLSQPYDLLPKAIGLLGAGFNSYSPDIDYYGDEVAKIREEQAEGLPASEPTGKNLFEIPLVGDQLAETGLMARLTFQLAPQPLFRLVEAGWVDEFNIGPHALLQAGARAKLFRRHTSYVPSAEAYVGLFKVDAEREGRGLSSYLTYSYNSPDPLTFPPVYDAHVMGIQIVAGNPIAMPPPVPTVQYPTHMLDKE